MERKQRSQRRLFPAEEHFTPYLIMANMVIPVVFMLREPMPRMIPGLLLLGLFMILYRQLYWVVKGAPYLLAAQAAITLLLAAVYNPMYAYVGFMLAHTLSVQKTPVVVSISAAFGLGIAAVAVMRLGTLTPELWVLLLPPLFGVCVLPFLVRISVKYKQMALRLQAATSQIERMAQQEERQRIARELHDTLGHTLTLISLKSEVTEKLIHRAPDKAAGEAKEIRETARAALKQMRELVTEMKVSKLSDEFIQAKQLCDAAGVELAVQETALPLSPLQETILATCFREAITNVVRHSSASRCSVMTELAEGAALLRVKDDGVGFAAEAVRSGSNGLNGIRERLMLVDGSLSVASKAAGGAEITLRVPLVIKKGGAFG